mmetsp:Transcript_19549/g.28119  ORF Transcript_19549/g.28119 Transcript_19549/m.28119 type:complete len:733 (-) Transcript_19549:182-2380(-)|eukprot:CAMPEP_0185039848 /NCGR_PEP_ID=MMETSP1103-20130426/37173_1 /TAXON_ID=36769 /ORGANISM="Paraphysomonas bandaiensis, Strain Caron Lab Isolate" /LENGTH=732 /DNA_ID=CAMNT_0027578899 /DNA_START=32 /DNA_END=2230 /DNA_ORIENTATION=+
MFGMDESLRWEGFSSESDSDMSDFDVDAIDRELYESEHEEDHEKPEVSSYDSEGDPPVKPIEIYEIENRRQYFDNYGTEIEPVSRTPVMELVEFDTDADQALREWRRRGSSIDEQSSVGSKDARRKTPSQRFATRSAEDSFSRARSLPESDINRTVENSDEPADAKRKKKTSRHPNFSHSVSVPVPAASAVTRVDTAGSDTSIRSRSSANRSRSKKSKVGVEPTAEIFQGGVVSALEYLGMEDTRASKHELKAFPPANNQVAPIFDNGNHMAKISEARTASVISSDDAVFNHNLLPQGSKSSSDATTIIRRPSAPPPMLSSGSQPWKPLSFRTKPLLAKYTEVHSFANAVQVVTGEGAETGMVLCATADSTVRLVDVTSGKVAAMYEGHSDRVLAVCVSEASTTTDSGVQPSRIVAAGSRDETVCIWDYKTRRLIHVLSKHEGAVWAVAVYTRLPQPLVVSGSSDCTIRSWNVHTGTEVSIFRGHTDTVLCLAIHFGSGDQSKDPPRLVSGGADNLIRLWDIHTGRHCRMLDGHSDDVNAVSVVADSSGSCIRDPKIVSGGRDRTVRVWDILRGAQLAVFNGHTDCIYGVVGLIGNFSVGIGAHVEVSSERKPSVSQLNRQSSVWSKTLNDIDDEFISKKGTKSFVIVSCGEDRTVRLWNVLEEKQVAILKQHRGSVKGVSVAPVKIPTSDTNTPPVSMMLMATCSWDKSVIYYDFASVLKKTSSNSCCILS